MIIHVAVQLKKIKNWIFSGNFLYNEILAIFLWFGLPVCDIINELCSHSGLNNYIIYKSVFYHLIEKKNLYSVYPLEYYDVNLYGPIFGLAIAPFSLMPFYMGYVLWCLFNVWVLYFAITKLPIQKNWKMAILILSSNEMMNNTSYCQINPFIAALILLGFVYADKAKNGWALFFILLATFIKLYGIVGFAFFLFNDKKWSFIKWTLIWSVAFFTIPMLLSNKEYIIHSYTDWFYGIANKASKNIKMDMDNDYQDISVMGMIRRIFHWPNLKTWWVLVFATILLAFQFIHRAYFKDLRFKLYMLCSVCIAVVIFSTSSESPTYIIAFPLVCLWFLMQNPGPQKNILFVFALILTCFSYSDIIPPYIRNHIIRPYSLKALPCFCIWIMITFQLVKKDFLLLHLNRKRSIKYKQG